MSIEFLSSVPESDPGSEGGIGFDYQWQVASFLCIEMLLNPETLRVICEYGEDVTLHKKDSVIEKIQVKKRDSGSWTFLELIKPAKSKRGEFFQNFLNLCKKGKRSLSLVFLDVEKQAQLEIQKTHCLGLLLY